MILEMRNIHRTAPDPSFSCRTASLCLGPAYGMFSFFVSSCAMLVMALGSWFFSMTAWPWQIHWSRLGGERGICVEVSDTKLTCPLLSEGKTKENHNFLLVNQLFSGELI